MVTARRSGDAPAELAGALSYATIPHLTVHQAYATAYLRQHDASMAATAHILERFHDRAMEHLILSDNPAREWRQRRNKGQQAVSDSDREATDTYGNDFRMRTSTQLFTDMPSHRSRSTE